MENRTLVKAMERYPVQSGECFKLATAVKKVAARRDKTAKIEFLKPSEGFRYLGAKSTEAALWVEHRLVNTRLHRVDSLTGAPGIESQQYLGTYYFHPEALVISQGQ